jgi:hypothetical protein
LLDLEILLVNLQTKILDQASQVQYDIVQLVEGGGSLRRKVLA